MQEWKQELQQAWALFDSAIAKMPGPETGTVVDVTGMDFVKVDGLPTAGGQVGALWMTTKPGGGLIVTLDGDTLLEFDSAKEVKQFCIDAHYLLKVVGVI